MAHPQALDAFLAGIFSRTDLAISIKTRIGVEEEGSGPPCWTFSAATPSGSSSFTLVSAGTLPGAGASGAFQYAVDHCDLPCVTMGTSFLPPGLPGAGRPVPLRLPLDGRPGAGVQPRPGPALQGGEPLTPEELRAFHDQLVEAYRQVLSGDRPVLGKMKELWFYWSRHFLQPEGPLKRIRKAKTLLEYRDGVNALFRDCPFQEEGPVTF